MSLELLTATFKLETLTPTKKLILLILANYADENNRCYPSYKHIAKLAGLKDHKNVQRIIKDFAEQGLLSIEQRYTSSGGQTSNVYSLKINPTPHRDITPAPLVNMPPNTKDKTKDKTIYDDEFDTFWKMYPRKVGKYNAYRSWKKAIKEINPKDLLVCTKNFKHAVKQTEEKYIPHAQTWLNGKRYEDVTYNNRNTKNNLAG